MQTRQAIQSELVQEFVGNAHGNLARLQELLEEEPGVVHSAWDWGSGDWETGLGAAAHMGRRDIAIYLLGHGARLDLFAAAMLGEVEIVRAILSAFPQMRQATGPHGIPLIDHARAGGEEAIEVVQLLEETLPSAEQG